MTTTTPEPRHLIGLKIYDFGRIEAVELGFDPAGGVFAVSGQNGAGKSTILDALEAVIAGRKAPQKQQPIRAGADSARIVADFGDLVVTRTYKAAASGKTTTTLKAENAEGIRYSSSEEIVGALWNAIAVDPAAFAQLPAREQVATLVELLGFDPATLDAQIADAEERRLVIGRDVKRLAAVVESTPVVPTSTPDDEVSAAALLREREAAEAFIAQYVQLGHDADNMRRAADSYSLDIDRMTDEVARLEREIANAAVHRDEAVAAHRDLDDRYKADEADRVAAETKREQITAQIENLDDVNRAVRAKRERNAAKAEHAAALARHAEQQERIDAARAAKAKAFEDASDRLPVPGLSITDGVVTLNGTPLSQASTGEGVEVGFRIVRALSPHLRAVLIRNGSNLDGERLAQIDALARDAGMTTLVELVGEAPDYPGVTIVDGAVSEVHS